MLLLALIVTHEEQFANDSGNLTWRHDKFSTCNQNDADT
jgi:hypothetical protein